MTDPSKLEELFHAARRLSAGAERDAYLSEECATDAGLRAKIDALLRAEARADAVFGEADESHRDARPAAAALGEVADRIERFKQRADGTGPQRPMGSVLQVLEARTDSVLGVQLDTPGPDDAPVRVTEEAKRLRDPSGRYQVLGEIGRGGVGVVYKGRDQDLGRDVAMKILKDDYAERPEVLERFVEEAQIGGQLQHPGIVPVYELGLQAGERPYFAMKLVKGETLAAQLARRDDPSANRRELLRVFEQVCQTLAYAHSRRVVHRDLKPANVMIGAFGEVQVVDWGFAKVLARGGVGDERARPARDEDAVHSVIETVRSGQDSGSHSLPGSMMGTPAYMSPEQAQGDHERLDERSDVFGLGAILCEILTGDPPYRKQEGDVVRQAAGAMLEPARRRLLECGAEEALTALCLECLAPGRAARPASAEELADRIAAYLTSVEERARQAEVRAAEARAKQRTTLVSALGGALILMLAAGTWIWLDRQAQTRHDAAMERVATTMSATSAAYGKAQSAERDETRWAAALSSAEQLVLVSSDEDVSAEKRAEADALLVAVRRDSTTAADEAERLARDAAMLARLDVLRISPDTEHLDPDGRLRVDAGGVKELERLQIAYDEAFRDYLGGTAVLETPLESALASLRRGDIEAELAIALDHWLLVRDHLGDTAGGLDPAGTPRLRELAALLDSESPWRTELRALLPNVEQEGARLSNLAERADLLSLGAGGCRLLAEALSRAGEDDAAIAVLRRGFELHSQDLDLCVRLALALEHLDEPLWQEAYETYRIAQRLDPERSELLSRQARALLGLERPVDAERLARSSVDRDPSSALAWKYLGLALDRQGQHEEATACMRRALELAPDDPSSHATLGFTLLNRGMYDEAIASYRRALELDDQWDAPHSHLGRALASQGKHDEALASFRRALELDPNKAHHHVNLGVALGQQGHYEQELESYERALEIYPAHMVANSNLGDLLMQQGRSDEGIEHFRRALEGDPRRSSIPGDPVLFRAGVHRNLGNALHVVGELEPAVEHYRMALELDLPDPSHTYAQLGAALGGLDRLDEAIESYRRSLEIAPGSSGTHNALGSLLRSNGALDEAIASYRRALELDPEFPQGYINLGQCFIERGELEEAASVFRQGADLFEREDNAFARKWSSYAREQIDEIEQFAKVEDFLAGRREAVSNREWGDAIFSGLELGQYHQIVALTEETMRSAPELFADHAYCVYNSAVAAARLAAGSATEPAGEERDRLRELARTWLAREVQDYSAWITREDAWAAGARSMLEDALQTRDFANVRGEALKDLPEEERAAWQELWTAIEDALEL